MRATKSELERRLENLFSPLVELEPPAQPEPRDSSPVRALLLQRTLDGIPDPIYVKDRHRTWIAVNAAFCDLIGRPPAELIGFSDGELLALDGAAETRSLEDRVFETGQPNSHEGPFVGHGGQARTLLIQRRPLLDPAGQIEHVVGVVRDVTDLRRVEAALFQLQSEYRAEHERANARWRYMRRWALWLAGAFVVTVVLLFVVVTTVARAGGSAGTAYADAPRPAATAPAPAVEGAERMPTTATATPGHTPSPTATEAHTSTPTHTPAALPPFATIVPTVDPQSLMGGADALVVPPTPAPLREFEPNVINIVLLGSDRRPDSAAWRTDVVILVSIDPDAPSVTMLSFPRDLLVYVPGWRWQRINLADGRGEVASFPGGGPALVKQAIQYNFGIPVQYYARVDFSGYKRLIDSVGGVDVVADCPLYDIFPDVPDGENDIISGDALSSVPTGTIDIPLAGVYHLDGQHALWYARSRKTTSDFDRSRRQQRVLRALWAEVQAQGVVSQLPQLWDSITQSVETDLTLNDMIYLADVGLRIRPEHIRSRFIDGSMLTWHTTETGASVLLYVYDEIAPYLDDAFAPLPRNIAAHAPSRVEVLNGTLQADWDRVAADRLSWDGFSVSSRGPAGGTFAHTTIIDYTTTQKGSRLSALADLFRVAPEYIRQQPDPASPVAYQVVVGEDFDPCQRPSRGRWPAVTPTATPAAP